MKKYDSYKDSGIEWIGEIPSHWKNTRIKFTVNEKNSLFIDGDWIESKVITEEGIRYITTGNVKVGYYSEQGNGYISNQTFTDLNCTEVFEGDLILSRLNNPIGRACIVPNLNSRIVTSVDNVIYRPDSNLNKRYLLYLFSSKEYFEHTELISRGATMQRISRGMLGNLKIPLPDIEEQTTIANYLDQKTTQIDDLIAKKERLIQLLEEERTAIINHAVTKGLDTTVPMKDSGIEWLGEIPAHWEVKKLKFMANLKSGENITSENIKEDGDYPVYGGNGLRGYYSEYTNDGDYILIGRQGALCGNIKYASNRFWASEHAIVCYLEPNFNWLWFGKLLESMNLNQYNQSAAQPGLAVGVIKNLSIPIPNIENQNEIVEFIIDYETRTDDIIQKTRKEIELLKEYKTALISEVVTGKLDVRDEK